MTSTLPAWRHAAFLASARLREIHMSGDADSLDRATAPAEAMAACELALDGLDRVHRYVVGERVREQVQNVERAQTCLVMAREACLRAIDAAGEPPPSGPRLVDDGPDEAPEPVTTSEGG